MNHVLCSVLIIMGDGGRRVENLDGWLIKQHGGQIEVQFIGWTEFAPPTAVDVGNCQITQVKKQDPPPGFFKELWKQFEGGL